MIFTRPGARTTSVGGAPGSGGKGSGGVGGTPGLGGGGTGGSSQGEGGHDREARIADLPEAFAQPSDALVEIRGKVNEVRFLALFTGQLERSISIGQALRPQ